MEKAEDQGEKTHGGQRLAKLTRPGLAQPGLFAPRCVEVAVAVSIRGLALGHVFPPFARTRTRPSDFILGARHAAAGVRCAAGDERLTAPREGERQPIGLGASRGTRQLVRLALAGKAMPGQDAALLVFRQRPVRNARSAQE